MSNQLMLICVLLFWAGFAEGAVLTWRTNKPTSSLDVLLVLPLLFVALYTIAMVVVVFLYGLEEFWRLG